MTTLQNGSSSIIKIRAVVNPDFQTYSRLISSDRPDNNLIMSQIQRPAFVERFRVCDEVRQFFVRQNNSDLCVPGEVYPVLQFHQFPDVLQ